MAIAGWSVPRAMLDAAMLERIAASVAAPHDSALCAVAGRIRERADAHDELVEALRASPHVLHDLPGGRPCSCGQCDFVRLRDAAIAKATGGAA